MRSDPVLPTRADPQLQAATEGFGGPIGRRARFGATWWTPVRVLLVLGGLTYLAGALLKAPCVANSWASPDRYEHLCYSDIPVLYPLRGLADGIIPYLQDPLAGQQPLEYPVLTGGFMYVAALLTRALGRVGSWSAFYQVNVVMLAACFLVTVAATAKTVVRRPWDAAMVAVAPCMLFVATINWDLLALALTSVSLLLWSRQREGWAGVALGLAVAAKLYPVVLLGVLLLLCWRAARMPQFGRFVLGAAVAWSVVNLPLALANPYSWSYFYTFSRERGEDFGSVWLALTTAGHGVSATSLNSYVAISLLLAAAGIAALIIFAPRRPRLAQAAFLIVAAFVLTNKVYSPQYVLWLLPLAVLARPRWRDFLIWQAAEVCYVVAIWWYLVGLEKDAKGLLPGWYAAAIWLHVIATLWFAALVVRDILRPAYDPIRSDGVPEHADDPGGGCLDGAQDRAVLRPSQAEPVQPDVAHRNVT
ncbi:MAG: DUF2029 domain-containing protein [Actinomycetota bacterium]|nr:MAG: DUF2029 domain-containing protein [Actinomycetota bacterium]